MDIAAMSIALANTQVRRDASLSIMKHAMQTVEQQNTEFIQMMTDTTPQHPVAGHHIDTSV